MALWSIFVFLLKLAPFHDVILLIFVVLSTFLKIILIFSHNCDEICKKYLHSP
jgi:hypothetical protein